MESYFPVLISIYRDNKPPKLMICKTPEDTPQAPISFNILKTNFDFQPEALLKLDICKSIAQARRLAKHLKEK